MLSIRVPVEIPLQSELLENPVYENATRPYAHMPMDMWILGIRVPVKVPL